MYDSLGGFCAAWAGSTLTSPAGMSWSGRLHAVIARRAMVRRARGHFGDRRMGPCSTEAAHRRYLRLISCRPEGCSALLRRARLPWGLACAAEAVGDPEDLGRAPDPERREQAGDVAADRVRADAQLLRD